MCSMQYAYLIHTHTVTSVYIHVQVHMRGCLHLLLLIFIYIYVYMCVCIYTYYVYVITFKSLSTPLISLRTECCVRLQTHICICAHPYASLYQKYVYTVPVTNKCGFPTQTARLHIVLPTLGSHSTSLAHLKSVYCGCQRACTSASSVGSRAAGNNPRMAVGSPSLTKL